MCALSCNAMGRRGPIPKPTALKRAAGNPGRRQLNENEPLPPEGEVAAPAWLTPEGKRVWDAIAPVAVTMKTLTTADVYPFARYCEAFARWLELNAWLKKNGTTYTMKGKDGKPRYAAEFPQAIEHRRLYEILIRLEGNFGLTASARSRLNVLPAAAAAPAEQAQKSEDLRDFFAGGGPAAGVAPRVIAGGEEESQEIEQAQADQDVGRGAPSRSGRTGKRGRKAAG